MIKVFVLINLLFGIAIANDALCVEQEEGTVFDNPAACDAYFMCRNGVAVPHTCPEGLYFDYSSILCNFPENVDCQSGPELPTDPTPTESPWPEPEPDVCPSTGVHILDHPHSCRGFISCFGGVLTEQTCASGTEWNSIAQQCQPPSLAQCTIEARQCPAIDDPFVIVRVPCTLNCNRFYICSNQRLIENRCGPGLHFNPTFGWCENPVNAGCILGPGPPPVEQSECPPDEALTFIPDDTDCQYFFICRHGLPLRERCAPGFIFDRNTLSCTAGTPSQC